MANLVIVTKHCYLQCERINYITMTEVEDEEKESSLFSKPARRKRKLPMTKKQIDFMKQNDLHQIIIDFIAIPTVSGPNSMSSRSNGEVNSSVSITVRGKDRCQALFMDMVGQIREQMPDHLFLDKLVDKFFTDNVIS